MDLVLILGAILALSTGLFVLYFVRTLQQRTQHWQGVAARLERALNRTSDRLYETRGQLAQLRMELDHYQQGQPRREPSAPARPRSVRPVHFPPAGSIPSTGWTPHTVLDQNPSSYTPSDCGTSLSSDSGGSSGGCGGGE